MFLNTVSINVLITTYYTEVVIYENRIIGMEDIGHAFKLERISSTCFLKDILTLSWQRSLSHRNRPINLHRKFMDWFLFDRSLLHERVIGTLIQIWKFHYMIAFIQKKDLKNFAFLIPEIIELLSRKICIFLNKWTNF